MATLERRIADLEQSSSAGGGPLTIIIRGMAPGELKEEIQALHDWKNGQRWGRQHGETERDLIDRASREVTRKDAGCCALLIADNWIEGRPGG